MTEIKNPDAYWHTVIKNLDKNEYRANDNFFEHIDSVGDEYDIRKKMSDGQANDLPDAYFLEHELYETTIENWLMHLENQQLHMALSTLPRQDLELLYLVYVQRAEQRQIAPLYELTPSGLNKRLFRIKAKIKKFFKRVNF